MEKNPASAVFNAQMCPENRCRSLIFRIEKYSVHFHWLSIKFHLTPSKAWKAGDMLCYHRDTSVNKFIDIHAIRLAIMMHVDGLLNAGGLARPSRHIHHQILWTWKFKSSILWIFHSGKRKIFINLNKLKLTSIYLVAYQWTDLSFVGRQDKRIDSSVIRCEICIFWEKEKTETICETESLPVSWFIFPVLESENVNLPMLITN